MALLTTSVSSVDAERAFSSGRLVINYIQHQMSSGTFQSQLAIGSWFGTPLVPDLSIFILGSIKRLAGLHPSKTVPSKAPDYVVAVYPELPEQPTHDPISPPRSIHQACGTLQLIVSIKVTPTIHIDNTKSTVIVLCHPKPSILTATTLDDPAGSPRPPKAALSSPTRIASRADFVHEWRLHQSIGYARFITDQSHGGCGLEPAETHEPSLARRMRRPSARPRDRWMLVVADHIHIARSVYRRALSLFKSHPPSLSPRIRGHALVHVLSLGMVHPPASAGSRPGAPEPPSSAYVRRIAQTNLAPGDRIYIARSHDCQSTGA
ncbi:hypothetical protein RHS04_08595 [Rhizoctonia solani]|uniref:HAT C-terminal dimerisation domain-containing protein n=1 Tax=Rhizoctonia solani TaxID=456999 RepID=A0A8H7GZM1_9AGAM|nr:hypothetical protein RHS04_08595 [Rhizoctonia solani]